MSMYKRVYADILAVKAVIERVTLDDHCDQKGEAAIFAAASEHGLPWIISSTADGGWTRTILAGGKPLARISNTNGITSVTLISHQFAEEDEVAFGLYLSSRTYELLLRLDYNKIEEQNRLLKIAREKQDLMAEVLKSMKD